MTAAPAPRLRVLNVITSLAGGAGVHAVELARRLDPARFDVLLAFGPGYPLDAEVRGADLPHRLLRWEREARLWSTLLGILDVARLLRRGQYDIVHAHCSLAGAVARPLARLLVRRPVVFTVHAFAAHERQPAWRQRLMTLVERWLDRATDRYVVTTARYRSELTRRGIAAADKVTLIPLGIVLAPPLTRAAARLRLGLADSDEVVLFSGRLEPQKGVSVLLQAWPLLKAARPGARLVILGDGPLRASLQAQAGDPQVLFAGWHSDASTLLGAADVFCLPSLWEAFGYVLLEAMWAGVPIVASAVGGIPEVLGGGRWGRLCPAGDAAALATALIDTLAAGPCVAANAAAARAHVLRDHDVQAMVAAHAALYEQLVAAQ